MYSELGESNIMPKEGQYRQKRTPHSRCWSKSHQKIDGAEIKDFSSRDFQLYLLAAFRFCDVSQQQPRDFFIMAFESGLALAAHRIATPSGFNPWNGNKTMFRARAE
jgi:hypothetical protein